MDNDFDARVPRADDKLIAKVSLILAEMLLVLGSFPRSRTSSFSIIFSNAPACWKTDIHHLERRIGFFHGERCIIDMMQRSLLDREERRMEPVLRMRKTVSDLFDTRFALIYLAVYSCNVMFDNKPNRRHGLRTGMAVSSLNSLGWRRVERKSEKLLRTSFGRKDRGDRY